jgi:VWFA-related protein
MKLFTSFVFTGLLLAANAFAQNAPAPTPTPDDGDIVKITTNLIQVDVTVLDKKGNQVTDLRPEDFEVRENGKTQTISNFSYVAISPETRTEAARIKMDTTASRVPPVPLKLRPEQVRRTIVLVVDDLGLSATSMHWVREALTKFVDEQMQPDDLVAILRTGSSEGALQQFTSDKRLLHAAISKIRWNIMGRGSIWLFEPIRPTTKDLINGVVDADGNVTNSPGNERDKETDKKETQFRNDVFTKGTLGTLRYIVSGLNHLPGRKRVILFSDGITMNIQVEEEMKRLIDYANRAGVVIDTIQAAGVVNTAVMGPENDTRGQSMEQIEALEKSQISGFAKAQEGLSYLAYETGGRPIKNTNNLAGGVARILSSENGYYLIAYEPPDETFDPKMSKFNTLEVKVKRPDVSVRYRSGFFGIADKDVVSASTPLREQLRTALTSPFGAKEIGTRLISIFANDPQAGDYSRALLHIDTSGLELTQNPNGTKRLSLDIYAYVFDAQGAVVNQLTKNFAFDIRPDFVDRMNAKGIIFPMNVPIEKPGAYQLRMAVRDTKSGKIGSASQFIEIPNLKKEKLALSGIILQSMAAAQLKAKSGANQGTDAPDPATSPLYDTATRNFKRGSLLIYNYAIYNARIVPGQGVKLQSYARLFRDGKVVFESTPQPVNAAGQTDLAHLEDRGVLTIGNDLAPGSYVLQIVTTDSLAKEKNQIAAQSIDFEVVE